VAKAEHSVADPSPQFIIPTYINILIANNLLLISIVLQMSMKAVVYQKPFTLKVEQVPKPKIEHPDDIIVKITTSAICGSDLHMYVYPPLQGFVTFVGRSYSC